MSENITEVNRESGKKPADVDISQIAQVLDMVNGLFCVYDTDGQIKYMNRRLKKLMNYPDEVLYKMNIVDIAIERQKRRIRESIRVRMHKPQESCWELPLRDKDGNEFYVIAKTSPLFRDNQVAGEILLVENITELKKAEAEVRESQRRMADIIESLPDATVVINEKGQILYWNREMVEMTGFPSSEMVGKGKHEYAVPFYGFRRPMLIDMVIDPGVGFEDQYLYVHKDGNVLYTETKTGKLMGRQRILWGRAAPIYNTKGEIVGAIESVRDITDRKQAEEELIKNNERLEAIFSGTVKALAETTEKRDKYTAGHQQRVAELACAIAQEMGLADSEIKNIKIAATLHDIGKLDIPLDILIQTGPLNDIEQLFIKTHPAAGYDILKNIPFDGPIAEIILQHHERMDGSGYPRGLVGDEILLEARILAVADVVEAMASHRPYRPALGIERALGEIQINSGRLYDPAVVEACLRVIKDNKFEFTDGLQLA